jgi:hypothetical protein
LRSSPDKVELLKAREQPRKSDLCFQPRQGRPKAMVDAASECQMLVLAAVDAERMWLFEHRGITITSLQRSNHGGSAMHGAASYLLIAYDVPPRDYDGRRKPQDFFYRASCHVWTSGNRGRPGGR